MPRGPSRPWTKIAPHTEAAIPYIKAAMEYGYDVEHPLTDLRSVEEAEAYRKGLHNAATLLGVSLHTTAVKTEKGYTFQQEPDGTYSFRYAIHKKSGGRKHILEKHGSDRTRWPYNPRRPSPRDEAGNRTDM